MFSWINLFVHIERHATMTTAGFPAITVVTTYSALAVSFVLPLARALFAGRIFLEQTDQPT